MRKDNKQFEHSLSYFIQCTDPNYKNEDVKIYFERDIGDIQLNYRLYLVIEPWIPLKQYYGDELNDYVAKLDFDEVHVVYDVNATDATPLSNERSEAYQRAEIKITMNPTDYVRYGSRIVLSQLEQKLSGAGQVMFRKTLPNGGSSVVRKFFFAINDMTRIHVDYSITRQHGNLMFELYCKNLAARFDVCVLGNNNRLPILSGDLSQSQGSPITVDFSSGCTQTFTVPSFGMEHGRFALEFSNKDDSTYYLLNLLYDTEFPELIPPNTLAPEVHVCPYCGEKMNTRDKMRAYEHGSVCCHSTEASMQLPVIHDAQDRTITQVIYCKKDLQVAEGAGRLVFDPSFMRLLPEDFYGHSAYRIALLGSVRAGKTTYLSRFFGLSHNGQQTAMSLRYLANAMHRFGVEVNAANVDALTPVSQGVYRPSGNQYYALAPFYRQRAIDLSSGAFPAATPSGVDCSRYPFIVEAKRFFAGKKAYVSFYDIPGEDAKTRRLEPFAPGERAAVFLFINSIRDVDGNMAVISALKAAGLAKETPIAVILAKTDLIETSFSPNAHCLRTDYYDLASLPYESGVGREILVASEEVKSYLRNESVMLDIESSFENVCYFALSSFTAPEALHKDPRAFNEPGNLDFENSTKRIELPLYWALKQFGFME